MTRTATLLKWELRCDQYVVICRRTLRRIIRYEFHPWRMIRQPARKETAPIKNPHYYADIYFYSETTEFKYSSIFTAVSSEMMCSILQASFSAVSGSMERTFARNSVIISCLCAIKFAL